MKIYLLRGSKGSWDCYYSFIIGVFSTFELACVEKDQLIKDLNYIFIKDYTAEEIKNLDYVENNKLIKSLINLDKYFPEEGYLTVEQNYENISNRIKHYNSFKGDQFNLEEFTIKELEIDKNLFDLIEHF